MLGSFGFCKLCKLLKHYLFCKVRLIPGYNDYTRVIIFLYSIGGGRSSLQDYTANYADTVLSKLCKLAAA